MKEQTKTVGEEFIEWLWDTYTITDYTDKELKEMADKINDIIHTRIIELLAEQKMK